MMVQKTSNRYSHLSQEKREEILGLVREGLSYRQIGRIIGRSHTTVSREIERNSEDHGRGKTQYSPMKAQKKYQERRYKANQSHMILWRDHKQRQLLVSLLKEKGSVWGPDEIIGRLRERCGKKTISQTTFYRFIRYESPELQRYLRYKQKGYATLKYKE